MSPVDAGPPIATINPVNGELLQSFEPLDADAVEARLATAAAGAARWALSTFAERSRLLVTAAELLEGEVPDIAHTITTEMGKPFAQAKGEVAKCAHGFRWFAEHAEQMLTDREVAVDASLGLVTYQPLGACLRRPTLPTITAGAMNRATCHRGKFHGMMASTTPRGW